MCEADLSSADQVVIFKGDFACLQAINLTVFTTGDLVFMGGKKFLPVWLSPWHLVVQWNSLSTIEPIDHQASRPSSLSTTGLLLQLLSLSACCLINNNISFVKLPITKLWHLVWQNTIKLWMLKILVLLFGIWYNLLPQITFPTHLEKFVLGIFITLIFEGFICCKNY